MRSILARILAWSLVTFVASLIAFGLLSFRLSTRGPGPGDFLDRTVSWLGDESARVYDEGGPEVLGAYLRRLDRYYPARHYLTDAHGRDLVDGGDRSPLLARALPGPVPGPPPGPGAPLRIARPVAGGKYRFVLEAFPRFDPWGIWPYFGVIVLVIAGMAALLAAHLAAPLRRLRRVVDRFGQGALEARAHSERADEIGQLSRAFDAMADRIATLLTAERRLLRDVSHELRSPLARLGFAIELARSGDDRGPALDQIQRDVERLSTLVEELLHLTRAEGDPSARIRQSLHLDELLATIVADCEFEAQARGCRVQIGALPPCRIAGDPELVRRAIENFLRNAVRYAPEGSRIDVDLEADHGLARIAVRDSGSGVPSADLEAIFEPFYRVESDRGRSRGGVGLGLAIARRAVVVHGGTITARNAEPGLRVTIELPTRTQV